MNIKGNIRVFCRIRPILASDKDRWTDFLLSKHQKKHLKTEPKNCFETLSDKKMVLKYFDAGKMEFDERCDKSFMFDRIFSEEANIHDIFYMI